MHVFSAPLYNYFIDVPREKADQAIQDYIDNYERPHHSTYNQDHIEMFVANNKAYGFHIPDEFPELKELCKQRFKYQDRTPIYAILVVPWVIDIALIALKCVIAVLGALGAGAKKLACGTPAKSAHHRR